MDKRLLIQFRRAVKREGWLQREVGALLGMRPEQARSLLSGRWKPRRLDPGREATIQAIALRRIKPWAVRIRAFGRSEIPTGEALERRAEVQRILALLKPAEARALEVVFLEETVVEFALGRATSEARLRHLAGRAIGKLRRRLSGPARTPSGTGK